MFRINHSPFRQLTLVDEETGEEKNFQIEYVNENVFNCFLEENGIYYSLLMNAEVEINSNLPDDLIIRTEHETYKVDFYMDNEDVVT